tara:strand:+ start:159 stop:542 length:384 start_codon:yes stop_codon:yes gene_type:complete
MKIVKLVVSCAVIATLTGCASIAGNNSRAVHVTSKPAGAGIFVDNQQYGVTPATITLPSNMYGGKTIALRKPGYQEQAKTVNTAFQPIAVLDVLFWPSIIVDGVTGNLVKLDPASTNLDYTLQRATA